MRGAFLIRAVRAVRAVVTCWAILVLHLDAAAAVSTLGRLKLRHSERHAMHREAVKAGDVAVAQAHIQIAQKLSAVIQYFKDGDVQDLVLESVLLCQPYHSPDTDDPDAFDGVDDDEDETGEQA